MEVYYELVEGLGVLSNIDINSFNVNIEVYYWCFIWIGYVLKNIEGFFF